MNSYNGFTPAQRMKALAWSKREEAAGRRQRPTHCECCRQDRGIIERHSEDYSEPFGEHIGRHALCYRCHMMLHCRFRWPAAFRAYAAAVAEGFCAAPLFTRDIGAIRSQLAGKFPAGKHGEPRAVTNLFTLVLERANAASCTGADQHRSPDIAL